MKSEKSEKTKKSAEKNSVNINEKSKNVADASDADLDPDSYNSGSGDEMNEVLSPEVKPVVEKSWK